LAAIQPALSFVCDAEFFKGGLSCRHFHTSLERCFLNRSSQRLVATQKPAALSPCQRTAGLRLTAGLCGNTRKPAALAPCQKDGRAAIDGWTLWQSEKEKQAY
jgi:hypothetical protein